MKQTVKAFVEWYSAKDPRYRELMWKQKESACLQYLLNLIGPGEYLASTVMAMSPVTICHILNEIIINGRKNVIELGSGNSTIYIARLLKKLDRNINFISVDSDDKWIDIIRVKLKEMQTEDMVSFVHAPIVRDMHLPSSLANTFNWYNPDVLLTAIGNAKFDLIIVDGPQGMLCPFARYPAFPYLKNNVKDSAIIFLDDASRTDEKEIARAWKEGSSLIISDFGRHKTLSFNGAYITTPQ